jgi:hypothetical protein
MALNRINNINLADGSFKLVLPEGAGQVNHRWSAPGGSEILMQPTVLRNP